MIASISGKANNFPVGQCTRWADERYHQLTGYYIPFNGNANEWATNALPYGWMVSTKPVVPSIICLQAGVQLASPTFGHVGVVESIGKGVVVASNLNWGLTTQQEQTVQDVTFVAPASGVSFIYAVDSNGNPLGSTPTPSLLSTITSTVSTVTTQKVSISLAPNASVTSLLVAMDNALKVTNPFDVDVSHMQDDINIPVVGEAKFTDTLKWLTAVGTNIVTDTAAVTVRLMFLIIGVLIVIKLGADFIDYDKVNNSMSTFFSIPEGYQAGRSSSAQPSYNSQLPKGLSTI